MRWIQLNEYMKTIIQSLMIFSLNHLFSIVIIFVILLEKFCCWSVFSRLYWSLLTTCRFFHLTVRTYAASINERADRFMIHYSYSGATFSHNIPLARLGRFSEIELDFLCASTSIYFDENQSCCVWLSVAVHKFFTSIPCRKSFT